MKKTLLLLIIVISCNSFSQIGEPPPPPVPPPPPLGCNSFYAIDTDNNGYTTFNIEQCMNYIRNLTLVQENYNLSGYSLNLYPTPNDYINETNVIGLSYINTIINIQDCYIKFVYSGSGPLYSQEQLNPYRCFFLIATPFNGNYDIDGVLNIVEDLNNNLNLMDDDTDGDGIQNYSDNDDDGDGILTINEDYNGNGSVLDDDMNSNGIIDYLDFFARGSLTVNLKLFLEGYYSGSSTMNSVKFNQDGISPITDVENITVELYKPSTPFELVASTTAVLKTNGTATCSFTTASVGSYYIAVKSKNSIPTWSANPQILGTIPLSYDFSSAANKAFGNNLKNLGNGVFGFFSGDINQDETIDSSDAPNLFNDIDSSEFGIKITDLNGDGSVDGSDTTYLENNLLLSIFSNHP